MQGASCRLHPAHVSAAEYSEHTLPPPHLLGKKMQRAALWAELMKTHADLQKCIVEATKWDAAWIPKK